MRKLALMVLSLAVLACAAGAPLGSNLSASGFQKGWRFLDGATPAPGDKVEPPKLRSMPPAIYPVEARRQRLTGNVGLEVTVDDAGQVVKVEVVAPLEPTLDEAAVATAQKASFTPARLNGMPKASIVRDVVTFSIQ